MKISIYFLMAILVISGITACSNNYKYRHVSSKQSASDPEQLDDPERIDIIVQDAVNMRDKYECFGVCDRRCHGEICYNKCCDACSE